MLIDHFLKVNKMLAINLLSHEQLFQDDFNSVQESARNTREMWEQLVFTRKLG